MSVTRRWLRILPRPSDGSCLAIEDVQPIRDPLTDPDLLEGLARELRRNYISSENIVPILEDLGAVSTADYVKRFKYPTKTNVRHGEFGEALTGALFRQMKRYCVPILKLRYKFSRDQPVHGTDVLGFRLTNNPPIVAAPEVKTRANRDRSVASEAQESLDKVIGRLDESIAYVFERFVDINPTLATRIALLLNPSAQRMIERHIVIIHDRDTWREDIVSSLGTSVESETFSMIVQVPELSRLVKAAYEYVPPDSDGHE